MKTRRYDDIEGPFPSLILTMHQKYDFDLQQYSHIPDFTLRLYTLQIRTQSLIHMIYS